MLSLAEITILSPFEMASIILSALVGSQIKFSFLLLLLLPNLAAAQTEGWESLQQGAEIICQGFYFSKLPIYFVEVSLF